MLLDPLPPHRRLPWRRILLLAPPVALALLVMAPMWADDLRLADMKDRLLAHPLPPDTSLNAAGAQGSVGVQEGNGDHCDFLVRSSLLTRLSEAELTSYYDRNNGRVYFQDGDPASAVIEFRETDDAGWDLRCR
ncbi:MULTISPECIES: hypothetical protein [unclassified Nonomuraea]|uniref:hypothetical protein n=1 Tax=unclassified Nonomuraea TaxID=2593643 RepID=UPI0033EC9E2C